MSSVHKLRAVLGVGAALIPLVLYAHRDGLLISPDSAEYLFSAQSLLNGQGFTGTNGSHLTTFPPGYPAVLATFGLLVGDLMLAALIVNMASLAAIAFTTHWVIARYTQGLMIPTAATMLLMINRGLWQAAGYVWTESLSLAVTAIALVLSIRLLESRRNSPAVLLILLGGVLGFGGLVRTAGVLMAAGFLLVLLFLRRPWWNALVVGFPAVVLPGAWSVVNRVIGGDLAGERVPSAAGPGAVMSKGMLTIIDWFTFRGWWLGNALLPIGVAAVLALIALIAIERQILSIATVRLIFLTNAIYLVLVVAVRSMVAMDDLGDRLLLPIVPGVVILAAIATSRSEGWRRVLAAVVAGGLLISGLAAVALAFRAEEPDLVGTLRDEACPFVEGVTISNRPAHLAWACGTPVQGSPRERYYASNQAVDELPALRETMSHTCVTLVWWGDGPSGYRVPLSELQDFYHVDSTDMVKILRGGAC